MGTQPRSTWAGIGVAALAVAATTAVIYLLRPHVPVLSTGVLYLLAVLLVSSRWGLWLGLLTSLASALVFNFALIPPTGRLSIADAANWLGLGVYLVAAVVVSAFAGQARARADEAERRRREADMAAELAMLVLGPEAGSLERAADRIATAFGVGSARIDDGWADATASLRALPLLANGERVGTLLIERGANPADLQRILPALGALMDARRRRADLEEQEIETESLRRSDTLKTALLRAVSHDLRSPLTAVRAAAGSVDSPTVDAEQRHELAEVIRFETDRLTGLVNDLLELSRLESGGAVAQREPCSLDEIVDAALASPTLREAAIDIALPNDLPPVLVDPAQLGRVVSNLLENAVHHGANGRPVGVRADANGGRVQLRITDYGTGIARSDLDHIFEPFFRAQDASGHGSGLGLAIAKGFVDGNGGRLWAQSAPGQGASFTVDLMAAG